MARYGKFIIIETHGGPQYACVVLDCGEDGNGSLETLVFDTMREALFSKEYSQCQSPVVVML